jgi:hypothetical protein
MRILRRRFGTAAEVGDELAMGKRKWKIKEKVKEVQQTKCNFILS